MVRHLISRPIAVFMAATAFFIIGVISYMNVPISLLPNIPIPLITVQVTGDNISARELENTVIYPIRRQLSQLGKLQDMKTETRDGSSIIKLNFKHGADIDLAFIDVNEKIDIAMNYIPRSIDRPRVVKASATDVPVFKLVLSAKNDMPYVEHNAAFFSELSDLSESDIRSRIEQLPQISMVDITGLVKKQIVVKPNKNILGISGITNADIENSLLNNNIEPGSMTIKDGHYEYNISFTSLLRTLGNIEDIYIKKNEKILQLKDIAQIEELPTNEKGTTFYNGKRAIVLDIIKQEDEDMSSMYAGLNQVISDLKENYPEIAFDITQNQTELLEYTISNLHQNLILAFIFVCLVSVLFLNDIRAPLIIGISVFVSLIITFLFFYLFRISLNVVSLTGLILALGMMIDNSIIVTDNIGQYRKNGLMLDEACIKGTNEVITPMLSSALTTTSVFLPLIFLSGIAGAIFFDQAFSVAMGLLVSYLTGIMFVPVLYRTVYSINHRGFNSFITKHLYKKRQSKKEKVPLHHRIYHKGVDWVFANKMLTTTLIFSLLPLCFVLLQIIPKEKMPKLSQNELIINIEWNEHINLQENESRIRRLLQSLDADIVESAAFVGQQQFLLEKKRQKTATESEVYLRVTTPDETRNTIEKVKKYFSATHSQAAIVFEPANSIFENIFATKNPDLTLELYRSNPHNKPTGPIVRKIGEDLIRITGLTPSIESYQKQLNIHIDRAKLLLHDVSFNQLMQTLETTLSESKITTLRSYQQYLPIVIAENQETDLYEVLGTSFVFTEPDEAGRTESIPLSTFVSTTVTEDLKTIVAGRNGEYIPYHFFKIEEPEKVIHELKQTRFSNWDVNLTGAVFTNSEMLREMMIILAISILLMYFILAAQFESFIQPLIVLLEIPIAITAALALLLISGHSLNLMSSIGIIVTCGIIINDSILKVDIMNQLRRSGIPLAETIHLAGKRRLNAILMTSLTSIVCMAPLLFSSDMGSELEKPLAIATIGGMVIGTLVSIFVVPLAYWAIYKNQEKDLRKN